MRSKRVQLGFVVCYANPPSLTGMDAFLHVRGLARQPDVTNLDRATVFFERGMAEEQAGRHPAMPGLLPAEVLPVYELTHRSVDRGETLAEAVAKLTTVARRLQDRANNEWVADATGKVVTST